MPAISKIRFTNVVYEDGEKRYNDDLFIFDGYNGAIVLENGGGKTVLVQTLLQAIIPHTNLGERKIRDTLKLEGPAHIAIEWMISEKPRRYVVTAVNLYMNDNKVDSLRYVYEYAENDADRIEEMPFVRDDGKRPAERYEMQDYYTKKTQQSQLAKTFASIKSYRYFLEEQYHIIIDEWDSIVKINQDEGGIEKFFDNCKLEKHLYDRLLIPTVEASIAGFDEKTFATIFEEQQKSFKLYKELRAQIEEYEAIEGELTAFVHANELLHKKVQEYGQQKSQVKGVYSLATSQLEKAEREHELLMQAIEQLERKQHSLAARRDSYSIRMKEEELATVAQSLQELEENRDRIGGNVFRLQKGYYSLQLAKQQLIEKGQSELLVHFNQEIDRLDREADASELADELVTVHQEMKGYFIEQEERLEKEKRGLNYERRPLDEELQSCINEAELLREERVRLEKEKTEKETRIHSLEESMQRIRQNVLANVEQETIKVRLPEWITTETHLDETIVAIQNETKVLRVDLERMKEEEAELQETIQKDLIAHTNVGTEVRRMEDAHTVEKEQLARLHFSFSRIDSLYMKQSSTELEMVRKIDQLKDEKEEKLSLERMAFRFIDDYAGQDVFFADPFLESQLRSWSNSIGLIETGVRYLAGLTMSIEEQLTHYPYWPVTLITTADKKDALCDRVKSIEKNLLHPIHVIDLQQAKALTESHDYVSSRAILPMHWQNNMKVESFKQWKETLWTEADKVKAERQGAEEQLQMWESAHRSLQDFFESYPYERMKEAEEEERELQVKLRQSKRTLERLQRERDEYGRKLTTNEQRVGDLKDELNGLQQKISAGRQHETESKDVLRLQEEAETVRLNLETHDGSVRKVMRRTKYYEEEIGTIKDKLNSIQLEIEWLTRDSYYHAVHDKSPLFTNKTLELLKARAESITFSLNKISNSRRELETKSKTAQEKQAEARRLTEQTRKDWSDFDETIEFPENGDFQMEQYRDRERVEKEQLETAIKAYNEQHITVALVREKVDELIRNFENTHPETSIVLFTESLHVIHNIISEEETKSEEEQRHLTIGIERTRNELAHIQEALRTLQTFSESDHFNSDSLEAKQLTEDELNEFTYGRMSVVKRVTAAMRQGRNEVQSEREQVANKRLDFNDYVRRNMSDAKMRDNLFQGLEYKQNYNELAEFHQNIRAKMNSIIRINEESIREHDERLEQFIAHMHEHARMVTRELEMIPTKTRIKFANDTKQIYHFRIPEWEDIDGLARLQAYINEVLGWIEHSRYVDPDGKVNNAKIRTDVEKWFATPQLLRVILQNADMKISCRKVTNDNTVTSKSFSWRESNEWSGGEKWSKNMTLFLGLLNYVAEKKKLLDTSMKRNRAVILDNPFGRASSEHVLSPVFFIAEKLGFQIIALTAHAEGKFLRDYFPIIYSCRLRSAKDTSKMIMTKVKTVNHAYFQDHEPATLDRLTESEQMSLLD